MAATPSIATLHAPQRLEPVLAYHDQAHSVLFCLPEELLQLIYYFCTLDYEDMSNPYNVDHCAYRPGQRGQRITNIAFLQTCQRAWFAARFLPMRLASYIVYLTWADRRWTGSSTNSINGNDSSYRKIRDFARMYADDPGMPIDGLEIEHVQIYAQQCYLERSRYLESTLQPYVEFRPQTITITVRHTDCWNWEMDAPLTFPALWVEQSRFPASVQRIEMQIETLTRKAAQLEDIVAQMRQCWYFTRRDNVRLWPKQDHVESWRGSSYICGQRYLRDEDDEHPGTLSYHVRTVIFKIDNQKQVALQKAEQPPHKIPNLDVASTFSPIDRNTLRISIGRYELDRLGATKETSASQVIRLYEERQIRLREEHSARMMATRAIREERRVARAERTAERVEAQKLLSKSVQEQRRIKNGNAGDNESCEDILNASQGLRLA